MKLDDTAVQERSTDRILVLKPIEGKHTLSSTGTVDNRILTGENNLHAVMIPRSQLWIFKLEHGGLPEPLKQQFTSFQKAKDFAEVYFKKRNIRITEVID